MKSEKPATKKRGKQIWWGIIRGKRRKWYEIGFTMLNPESSSNADRLRCNIL